MSGINLGTATGYLDLDLSKFSKGIDEAKAKASTASKDLGSAMNTVGGYSSQWTGFRCSYYTCKWVNDNIKRKSHGNGC